MRSPLFLRIYGGNILATVHQKANGNYVIEIKTRHIVSETLINFVKFRRCGAEFE